MARNPDLPGNTSALLGKPNNLFPTFDTLGEVMAYADSKMPKEHHNDLYAILMAYSNTLIKAMHK